MVKLLISQLEDVIKIDEFVASLNKYLRKGKLLLVPSDPSREDLTELYGKEIVDDFKEKFIEFTDIVYLSKNNLESIKSDINSFSMIFLMGGITLIQNEFIKEINLKEALNEYDGILVGQSAGALNMCEDIYFCNNECVDNFYGLSLVNLVINVHFTKENEEYIKEKNLKTYCITNEGAILINDTVQIIGDVYLYEKNVFSKIN